MRATPPRAVGAPPPIGTRVEAVALAERCLAHLAARGGAELAIGGGHLALLEALKHLLVAALADELQSEPRAFALKDAELWARRRGWELKVAATDQLDALRGLGEGLATHGAPSAAGFQVPRETLRSDATAAHADSKRREEPRRDATAPAPLVVLAVPRTKHHLRDMLLLAEHGRDAGAPHPLDVRFLTFSREHTETVRARGLPAALAGAYAPRHVRDLVFFRTVLLRELVGWVRSPLEGVEPERWRRITARVERDAQAYLPQALVAAHAVTRALAEVTPDVVLVGNPVTLEGRVAVCGARAMGRPSAALQHGDFNPAHAEWGQSGVSLITAWGPGPAATLVKLGVAPERIAVTGAPWADRLRITRRTPRTTARRRILVALSGAGHSVGLPEHTTHVRRILEATAALPEHDFVFRLHPKDRPALYEALLRELPGARATIVESKAAGDIHDELPTFDALITVTSTSATDAMLHGVPVVTLGRPRGEVLAAFVTAGATTHAELDQPLAEVLRSVLAGAATQPERDARVDAYVAQFFGARDGGATARIAAALTASVHAARGG